MKLDTIFLRSKVSRRIFGLFVCCALLPIVILSVVSFGHVAKQLNEQNYWQIHQESKNVGMAIFERLLLLEMEMKTIAFNFRRSGTTSLSSEGLPERLEGHFKNLTLITANGDTIMHVLGRIEAPPVPTPSQMKFLSTGNTIVSSRYGPNSSSTVFMMYPVNSENPCRRILVGEIDAAYLWSIGHMNTLSPMTELCILDESNNVLYSSIPVPEIFSGYIAIKTDGSASRRFKWKYEDKEYLASYWTIFLKVKFFTPKWTVVLSRSKSYVFAPLANFKRTFPLVVLLSLWVVLLLSIVQIRKSLVPLEKLKKGTERIAMGNFDSRVSVISGDEFQELAESFNTMSSRLGRQFNTLTTIAEIDRVILVALDTDKIIETVLSRIPDVFSCASVSVSLFDSSGTNTGRTYTTNTDAECKRQQVAILLKPKEVQELRNNPDHLFISTVNNVPQYLEPISNHGIRTFIVLPIFLKERLAGIISLGYVDSSLQNEEDLTQARQLANQVAVALSNVHLVEELNKLNWGSLTALARAVDAKSPWTAGHSERVTDLALRIARHMGIAQKELEVLKRAGLLHDIGKIGIPAAILDKPGKLTDEEYQVIKEHPRMGSRILEPIEAYAEVIPIVLQHHEWFDGQGYPDGLTGKAICLGAKIVAVADVFDALVSDRPYRSGCERERAVELIRQGARNQFDPKVVQAFLDLMAQEEQKCEPQVRYRSTLSVPDRPNDTSCVAGRGL